jgi:hypothetical protein
MAITKTVASSREPYHTCIRDAAPAWPLPCHPDLRLGRFGYRSGAGRNLTPFTDPLLRQRVKGQIRPQPRSEVSHEPPPTEAMLHRLRPGFNFVSRGKLFLYPAECLSRHHRRWCLERLGPGRPSSGSAAAPPPGLTSAGLSRVATRDKEMP